MYPEMITINEASRRTGMSYHFIDRLCKQGQIVHVMAGRKRLINWQKFEEFLNGSQEEKEKV